MDDTQAYTWRPKYPGYRTTRDHALRLNVWNAAAGVTVTVTGAVGGDDGMVRPFVYSLIPSTTRALSQQTQQLEDGILLWCQVFASIGTPIGAQCYARLELVQGSTGALQTLATIANGYLSANVAIGYPDTQRARAVDGRGTFRSVANAAPAAGADFTATVPTNARWSLQSVAFALTTSATVGNRTPLLTIDDGVNILWQAGNNAAVAASITATFYAGAGVQIGTVQANVFQIALPEPMVLAAGFRVRSITGGIVAGDQYSQQFLNVEEWLDV